MRLYSIKTDGLADFGPGYKQVSRHNMDDNQHIEPDFKSEAELRKLKAETDLLELQIKEHKKDKRLELYKSLGTFITAIVALLGLFFTYNQQHSQLLQLQKQHLDDDFSKDIQQFASSTNDASKLISITKLSTYFQPQYEQYHEQIIGLFTYYIQTDSSQSVQSIIQKELVNNASEGSLKTLIEQNRLILKDIFDRTNLSYSNLIFLPDSSFTRETNSMIKNLKWNINTIVQSINKIKKINNLDFSKVFLGRTPLSFEGRQFLAKGQEKQLSPTIILSRLNDSLNFSNVNFSNAVLCGLNFNTCDFQKTNFDNCNLINTRFNSSSFSNSSFKDFTWDAGVTINKKYIEINHDYPTWYNCKIHLINFSPNAGLNGPLFIPKGLTFFYNSTWDIQNIDSSSKEWFGLKNKN
ncbi:MAG: pentapeptide repeat-containing protein [Bacteroidia bacterium]|nr:pentapeptide repeat-containing protein [Bacteroidia bacterium]